MRRKQINPKEPPWRMSRIRHKDTVPELAVRGALSQFRLRYRLLRKDLSGRPNVILSLRHVVIRVRGCFWCQHPSEACPFHRFPKRNFEYWEAKLTCNLERDGDTERQLQELGWRVLTIWEYATRNPQALSCRLSEFLEIRRKRGPSVDCRGSSLDGDQLLTDADDGLRDAIKRRHRDPKKSLRNQRLPRLKDGQRHAFVRCPLLKFDRAQWRLPTRYGDISSVTYAKVDAFSDENVDVRLCNGFVFNLKSLTEVCPRTFRRYTYVSGVSSGRAVDAVGDYAALPERHTQHACDDRLGAFPALRVFGDELRDDACQFRCRDTTCIPLSDVLRGRSHSDRNKRTQGISSGRLVRHLLNFPDERQHIVECRFGSLLNGSAVAQVRHAEIRLVVERLGASRPYMDSQFGRDWDQDLLRKRPSGEGIRGILCMLGLNPLHVRSALNGTGEKDCSQESNMGNRIALGAELRKTFDLFSPTGRTRVTGDPGGLRTEYFFGRGLIYRQHPECALWNTLWKPSLRRSTKVL